MNYNNSLSNQSYEIKNIKIQIAPMFDSNIEKM